MPPTSRSTQYNPMVRVTRDHAHGPGHGLPCAWHPCSRTATLRLWRPANLWAELGVDHQGDEARLCGDHYTTLTSAEARERWPDLAYRLKLDPKLNGRARAHAVAKATGFDLKRLGFERTDVPNLGHMHALLDSAESGYPERWRSLPISFEEIRASERATARHLRLREPGEEG